jgi:heme/copper-type cytochrome/quinol oxidase subunit 2
MSKRQVIILVAVGAIVVVGVLIGIFTFTNNGEMLAPGEGPAGEQGPGTAEEAGGTPAPTFTTETPANAEPTEPAEQSVAAPGAEESFGAFNMTVSSTGFSPNSITVTKGDVVQIRLTAEGGDYDFSMPYKGLYVMVPEGETKPITFGINTAGTYGFMCRDYCPGRTISGSLIVIP